RMFSSSTSPATQHKIIRKEFHYPSAWDKNPHFTELLNHQYDPSIVTSHEATINFVSTKMKLMGYGLESSMFMKHDYLAYMLEDVLRKNGHVFLTEADMKDPKKPQEQDPLIKNIRTALSSNPNKLVTPDLFVPHGNNQLIIEVYT